ncbi:MAG: sortase [Candidatus Berkelbacteria bacterium]
MKNVEISESDLVRIFSQKKKDRLGRILSWMNSFLVFGVIFVISYFVINFNAFVGNVSFWFKTDIVTETPTVVTGPTLPTPDVSVLGVNFDQIEQIDNNSLSIQTTGIKAPVSWRTPNDTDTINANLKKGVVHLEGTALPGEKGNVFLAGHSSDYIWSAGSFNGIFSLNNKLIIGDIIHIKYQDKDYLYTVSEKKTVKPTDIAVMKSDATSKVTLSTCWPLGTSLRRLIIVADQVYPDPKNNTESSYNLDINKIPNSR